MRQISPDPSVDSTQGPLARCSPRPLRILIGLTLDQAAAARVRAELVGDPHPVGLREAVVLDGHAASRLEAILARQVRAEAGRYAGRSLSELAGLWARERHALRGSALAALLWSVTCRRDPVFRKLEERLAEEIEVLAMRALARP